MSKTTAPNSAAQTLKVMAQQSRDRYVADLQDGRHVGRATTFKSKKDKGGLSRSEKDRKVLS